MCLRGLPGRRTPFATAALLLVCAAARAGTLYVDDNAPNDPGPGDPTVSDPLEDGSAAHPFDAIQQGIDAAVAGDTVEVADGNHTGIGNRNLDFGGKAITVRSASGDPATCIIDCQGAGRGFYFHRGETLGAVVDGITISNGHPRPSEGYEGGGIKCEGASPTVRNCVLVGNTAGEGGGISLGGSDAVIVNCRFRYNSSGNGGAILCGGVRTATIANCTIVGNYSTYRGGGVSCDYSGNLKIVNCTVCQNAATEGGGLFLGDSTLNVANCIVWANWPEEIKGLAFVDVRYSDVRGGWPGVGNIDADPMLTGGAPHLMAGSPCLNAGDPALDYAGQLDIDGEPRVLGTGADIGADEFIDSDADGLPDWWEQRYFGSPSAADPRGDADADGKENLPEYVAGSDPLVAPAAYYVSPAGNDDWDGRAAVWDGQQGPKLTIRAAIDAADAMEGDIVNVADGVYSGARNKDLDFRGKVLTLRSIGGPATCVIDCENLGRAFYFHCAETAASVVEGFTMRRGNVSSATMSPGGANGGAIHCAGSNPSIIGCRIIENSADDYGGGIYCVDARPTVTNCTIAQNSVYQNGGGVYGDPVLSGCIIQSNMAGREGGGVCGTPLMTDCVIDANRAAAGSGGGAYLRAGTAEMHRCMISGNSSTVLGGGVYVIAPGQPLLTACAIAGNSSGSGGGVYGSVRMAGCAVWANSAASRGGGVYGVKPSLIDCTFTGNTAGQSGGALTCGGNVGTLLTVVANCILWGNSAPAASQVAVSGLAGRLLVEYSDVEGGQDAVSVTYDAVLTWASGNIDSDPLFVDPDGPDNDPATWADNDYRLRADSPCIDAGDNTAVPADTFDLDGDGDVTEPLPVDLAGNPRFVDDPYTPDTGNPGNPPRPVVDMGAYEVPYLRGDGNCDGGVDLDDINPFVLALVDQTRYEVRYPGCPWRSGDVNGDGGVDFDDINPFVACLVQEECP